MGLWFLDLKYAQPHPHGLNSSSELAIAISWPSIIASGRLSKMGDCIPRATSFRDHYGHAFVFHRQCQ